MTTRHPARGDEVCSCGAPATHKIGEEIPGDDPMPDRHNLTAYVCCRCFTRLLGPATGCGVLAFAGPGPSLELAYSKGVLEGARECVAIYRAALDRSYAHIDRLIDKVHAPKRMSVPKRKKP